MFARATKGTLKGVIHNVKGFYSRGALGTRMSKFKMASSERFSRPVNIHVLIFEKKT